MNILYLDCFAGISGDMTLAALVDAGADPHMIESELRKLPLEPHALVWDRVMKKGISAVRMRVIEPHASAEDGDRNRRSRHAHHRSYRDIVRMFEAAEFPDAVKKRALFLFATLAEAEAKIHDIPVEDVHFHEIGALDSLVDIVGVAIALHLLEIDQIICGPVPVGSGTLRCQHGIYPVPAPATLEILKGIPLRPALANAELTTPTGAAIAKLADSFGSLPPMIVERIGYGAGEMDFPTHPNVLRVVIGKAMEPTAATGHGL